MGIHEPGLTMEHSAPPSGTEGRLRQTAEIGEIAARLRKRYPPSEISPADLTERVSGYHHRFDAARIRSYVPILVEHLARRSIETPSFRSAPPERG
ncbi:three-helix bundle dimerization domain-containing protein [Amycolatopsis sp. cmx-8-4]|uniref:three-helix bundle dimerization domain-containing protein n=1 Tax=Amycolatopsis sp. cmx-8-4 TaxID=2790947 RepID=UPI00397DE1B8